MLKFSTIPAKPRRMAILGPIVQKLLATLELKTNYYCNLQQNIANCLIVEKVNIFIFNI